MSRSQPPEPDSSTWPRQPPSAGGAAAAHARLSVVFPPELASLELELLESSYGVGRTADGPPGLAVDHPTVSRRHLGVAWDEARGTHVVRDLGSRNGSAVDGATLGEGAVSLWHGTVLRAGDVLLVYERGEEGADPPTVSREAVPGRSMAMRALRLQLARAAADAAPVLLVGETGSGKERIGAEVHRQSGRAGPHVVVNCAALTPSLVESQLFGHARGAFTGATEAQPGLFRAAHGGSLFLDEIGELPLPLQAKLLRAIQEREVHPVGATRPVSVDVRVIAATNVDLAAASEAGQFRRDLYARLSMWELAVPPLRERRVDLFDWIARVRSAWLGPAAASAPPLRFHPDAAEQLLLAPHPLNLRGIERLVREIGAPSDQVSLGMLPAWALPGPRLAPPATDGKPAAPSREEFVAAFAELGGSVHALARRFARDRRQIYRWMDAYGLRDGR